MDRMQELHDILSILKHPGNPVDSFKRPKLLGADFARHKIRQPQKKEARTSGPRFSASCRCERHAAINRTGAIWDQDRSA